MTPFRSQNVPPPMSSFKLVLPSARAPVHASFSSTDDTVAFLWESGLLQAWNLQTRLGPGPGKIMDPVKVGEGSVPVGLARRVSVSAVVDGKITFAILGSRENDVLTYAEVEDGIFVAKKEVDLPGPGGTIPDAAVDIWQDSTGQVFLGWLSSMSLCWLLTRIISRCLRICRPDHQVTRILSRHP
jgi:elongator complex protein 1